MGDSDVRRRWETAFGAVLGVLVLFAIAFLLVRPEVILHDDVLTIIDSRLGELDIHVWPDGPITVWYQDIEKGVNFRLLVIRR